MVRNRVSDEPSHDDATLIGRAQRGDEEAFHSVFSPYEEILRRPVAVTSNRAPADVSPGGSRRTRAEKFPSRT